tara:strand:- start:704 stop:1009 length:306 start_codon:yes stop_codon:yes gene_type:complete
MMTMERQFRYFVQAMIQSKIDNAHVTVRFGAARDKRCHFDTDHDGFNIVFTLDPVYLYDPAEVKHIYERLIEWIDGWNAQERSNALTEEQASRITEEISDE